MRNIHIISAITLLHCLKTLKLHKERKHVSLRYPCDQCNRITTQSSNLKANKENIHIHVISVIILQHDHLIRRRTKTVNMETYDINVISVIILLHNLTL